MKSLHAVECPACKKTLPTKAIPKHVSGCRSWSSAIGIPPSEFNWDAYCKRGPYADGLAEGTDYVRCLECAQSGRDSRFKRMMDHLKKVHGLSEAEYVAKHPGSAVRVAGTAQKRAATVKARYGVGNVFQAGEVKDKIRDSMSAKYGAPTVLQVPSLRKRVEDAVEARYGVRNVFAVPDMRDRLRKMSRDRYGVEYFTQAPEVIARRVATNMKRYGSPVPQGFGVERKTRPEEIVDSFKVAGLYYTGNHAYWVRCKGADGFAKNRNPDFVVYTPEQLALVESGTPPNEVRTNKVVEVLGDWWHREEIVGLPRDAYAASRIAEYASIGISCLILWESEVKTRPDEVRSHLAAHLAG